MNGNKLSRLFPYWSYRLFLSNHTNNDTDIQLLIKFTHNELNFISSHFLNVEIALKFKNSVNTFLEHNHNYWREAGMWWCSSGCHCHPWNITGKVICGRDSLPEMTEIVSDIEQEFIDGKSINSLKWKHFNTFHNLFGQRWNIKSLATLGAGFFNSFFPSRFMLSLFLRIFSR